MELNETFEYKFSYSQEDVNDFARVTGDNNPIHLDENYAKKSVFQNRIIHGFLAGSIFSKIFGTIWPGEGTIYMSQQLKFVKPMYTNQTYLAKLEVVEILPNNKFIINTLIVNPNNENTVEGQALIKTYV